MAGATTQGPKNQVENPLVNADGTSPAHPGSTPVLTGTGPNTTATAMAAAASGAAIQIAAPSDCDKASDQFPVFSITAEPKMPVINITVKVVGISGADPTADTEFTWEASISFDSAKCPNGMKKDGKTSKKIDALTVSGKGKGGQIVVDFSKMEKIRGGDLKIRVSATVGGAALTAETKSWRIQGTNPAKSVVGNALPDDTHRKIACAESTMMQFSQAPDDGNVWYPYFSSDQKLGVGICQLTNPAPTDDQIWDWTENVKRGISLYNEKKAAAKKYPSEVEKSASYLDLIKKYNASLTAQAATDGSAAGTTTVSAQTAPAATSAAPPAVPVKVTVPPFKPDELEDDIIRGFNGWAGQDAFGGLLHEFRIQVDKATGSLVVVGDPKTGTVSAQWERVPVAERPGSGDRDYINSVKNRDPNTCAKLQ